MHGGCSREPRADGNQCPSVGPYDDLIKNTFIHIPAPPEPEELRRGRTAPPKVHGDFEHLEPEAEPTLAKEVSLAADFMRDLPVLADFPADVPPCPDALCRHSTHDVFESGEGQSMPWPCYFEDGAVGPMEHFAPFGYPNQGNEMDYVPVWEGQHGVQTGGEVMHPAPGTAVLVGSSVCEHLSRTGVSKEGECSWSAKSCSVRSCTLLLVWLPTVALAVLSPTWCPCTSVR